MLSAHARRADADDAVIRAERARTSLQRARERLAGHKIELERRRTVVDVRRHPRATRPRPGG
jgi:hypothetical protein